jgi:hypothetical protein
MPGLASIIGLQVGAQTLLTSVGAGTDSSLPLRFFLQDDELCYDQKASQSFSVDGWQRLTGLVLFLISLRQRRLCPGGL